MLIDARFDAVRACTLFSRVRTQKVWQLAEAAEAVHLPRGRTLFRRDDPGDALYVLVEGRMWVVIEESGRRYRLAEQDPPQGVGIIGGLDGGPRTANAEAAVASTLLRIGHADLWEVLDRDNDLYELLAEACATVRRQSERERDMLLGVPERLARLLLALSGDSDTILLRQEDVAELLGTTREVVSRALRGLKDAGAISTAAKMIQILDRRKLGE